MGSGAQAAATGGEDALVAWLRRTLGSPARELIGDDAAMLRLSGEWALDGRQPDRRHAFHCRARSGGRRAAAAGGERLRPRGGGGRSPLRAAGVVGAARRRPSAVPAGVRGVAAKGYGVTLAGGDVARAPLVVASLTLLGRRRGARWLRRDAARPGDGLWIGGTLGESALGRLLLERGASFRARPRGAAGGPHCSTRQRNEWRSGRSNALAAATATRAFSGVGASASLRVHRRLGWLGPRSRATDGGKRRRRDSRRRCGAAAEERCAAHRCTRRASTGARARRWRGLCLAVRVTGGGKSAGRVRSHRRGREAGGPAAAAGPEGRGVAGVGVGPPATLRGFVVGWGGSWWLGCIDHPVGGCWRGRRAPPRGTARFLRASGGSARLAGRARTAAAVT